MTRGRLVRDASLRSGGDLSAGCGGGRRSSVIADYLDAPLTKGPVDFTSAGSYFATLMRTISPDGHRAIRQRGADVAAVGRDDLLRALVERLAALRLRLRSLEPGHLVAVTGGKVMSIHDYLTTRIVEQRRRARSTTSSTWCEAEAAPAGRGRFS